MLTIQAAVFPAPFLGCHGHKRSPDPAHPVPSRAIDSRATGMLALLEGETPQDLGRMKEIP